MAQIKVFYVPGTRATRALWLMEELVERGPVDWEAVRLDVKGGENKRAPYLAIHPLGQVPAILDGETPVFESVAICLYLADRFLDRGLAPTFGSPLRAPYYQWAAFNPATLEPAIGEYARHTAQLPEAERVPALAEKAKGKCQEAARALEAVLAGKEYLVGDRFTAADILTAGNLNWARRVGLLEGHPALGEYATRLLARPAAVRAYKLGV